MKVCKDCYAELTKVELAFNTGKCSDCQPSKKKDDFPKNPKKGFEWYGPKPGEKVVWENVPSPYKAYKDGV